MNKYIKFLVLFVSPGRDKFYLGKNTEREKNLMMVEKIVKFDEKTKINDEVDAKNEDVQDKETKGKKGLKIII